MPADRRAFYQLVHLYFFPHSLLIVSGDFNCYDGSSNKFGGAVSISSDLWDVKSCFFLSDTWRALHPRVRQFTWFNSDSSVSSRLDTFLWQEVSFRLIGCVIFPPCVFFGSRICFH